MGEPGLSSGSAGISPCANIMPPPGAMPVPASRVSPCVSIEPVPSSRMSPCASIVPSLPVLRRLVARAPEYLSDPSDERAPLEWPERVRWVASVEASLHPPSRSSCRSAQEALEVFLSGDCTGAAEQSTSAGADPRRWPLAAGDAPSRSSEGDACTSRGDKGDAAARTGRIGWVLTTMPSAKDLLLSLGSDGEASELARARPPNGVPDSVPPAPGLGVRESPGSKMQELLVGVGHDVAVSLGSSVAWGASFPPGIHPDECTPRPRDPQRVRRRRRRCTFRVGCGKSTRTPPCNTIGLHSSCIISCMTGLLR
mmetsp:Transcript_6634/g.17747  ORF Transcript_6634/g.17747 Transcript_6634/m.17747 type:complete len:311 (+) Transcript_6634:246-1178(+)